MKSKIRKINIRTGDILVALLNKADAQFHEIYNGDRVRICTKDGKSVVAFADITENDNLVKPGNIGLFEDTYKEFGVKSNEIVSITSEKKPESITYIKRKLLGKRLSYDEFYKIIDDISNNRLSHIEITYFVAACYTHELSTRETVDLTNAMIETGDKLTFAKELVFDKHCVGGIAGNRTTMLVVPIIAACGYKIPKTSSRSITSAAGTADTVEVLCKVNLSIDEMKKVIDQTGGCLVWGGTLNLAPSDDKIIKVEAPISLDPTGQLLASILAKKKSVGANNLLIDIPVGKDAKIESMAEAKKLKSAFRRISRAIGMNAKIIITDGSAPIGRGIGPALEARDVLWTLSNDPRGCLDLREKSIFLATKLLKLAKVPNAEKLVVEVMDNGKAYEKFVEIVKAQGGKEVDPSQIILGKHKYDYRARVSGKITHISNKFINRVARIAGAPSDVQAGVYLYVSKGENINKGQRLFTVYSNSMEKLDYANEYIYREYGIEIKVD